MFVLRLTSVLLAMSAIRISIATSNQTDQQLATNTAVRAVLRVYDECQNAEGGFSLCIKRKAITFVDRVIQLDSINVGDGIKVLRSETGIMDDGNSIAKPLDPDWEQSLPRGLEAKDEAISNLLLSKVTNLLSGRTIKVTLPAVSAVEIGRGLEEGRGKMKKMMGMMMMGFVMKMAAMVPVAIALLYVLAGKALIISKIALLLAGIIGIKKLLSSKQSGGGGGGSSTGWQSSGSGGGGWQNSGGGGGGSGGWDRRSSDVHNIVYKGYLGQS